MEIRDPEAGAEGVLNLCKVLIHGLYSVKLECHFCLLVIPSGYQMDTH
jgi:hypothetical protein